eukprot:g2525.t1
MPKKCLKSLFRQFERLIQQDEGGRGISHIVRAVPSDGLYRASRSLLSSSSSLVLTGFPCHTTFDPPTETDGPLGALAICRSLSVHGYQANIVTDKCNANAINAALKNFPQVLQSRIKVFAFPSLSEGEWAVDPDGKHSIALRELANNYQNFVAIERAGNAKDGEYYTMNGTAMSSFCAPLDRLFDPSLKEKKLSIAIGDGGNELGMGHYSHLVEQYINNGSQIACQTGADILLPVSVSNWGGYALAVAIDTCMRSSPASKKKLRYFEPLENISAISSNEEERELLVQLVEIGGARDGCSGEKSLSVDGMDIEVSLQILTALRELSNEYLKN